MAGWPSPVMTQWNTNEREEPGTEYYGSSSGSSPASLGGVDALIASVSAYAKQTCQSRAHTSWFVRTIAADYAYIHLEDVVRPGRFLRQMAGAPPVRFGVHGFRRDVVDDSNPARHYAAFVFLGYYLPGFAADLALYLWEMAGYIRYRGKWSKPDMRNGRIGIMHGRLVRRYGPTVLPSLIAGDLAER